MIGIKNQRVARHKCKRRLIFLFSKNLIRGATLLEQVVIDAINRVLCQKDDFLQTLRANSATVVLQGDVLSPEVIDERLSKLQKELLKKVNQKDDYDAIADEILRLRDQRRQAEVDSVIKDEQMKKIRDLQDFVKSQPATITEFV